MLNHELDDLQQQKTTRRPFEEGKIPIKVAGEFLLLTFQQKSVRTYSYIYINGHHYLLRALVGWLTYAEQQGECRVALNCQEELVSKPVCFPQTDTNGRCNSNIRDKLIRTATYPPFIV